VLGNWEREVKKFGPTLKVLMHHGDKRPKGKAFTSALQRQDLVITSYALIQGHERTKAFPGKEWSWMKPKILKTRGEAVTVSAAVAILISDCADWNAGREQASRTVVNFRFSQSRVFRIAPVFFQRFAMPIENMGMRLRCKHCDRSFSPLFCGSKQTAKSFKTCQKSRK